MDEKKLCPFHKEGYRCVVVPELRPRQRCLSDICVVENGVTATVRP